jgi:hypothetical protein
MLPIYKGGHGHSYDLSHPKPLCMSSLSLVTQVTFAPEYITPCRQSFQPFSIPKQRQPMATFDDVSFVALLEDALLSPSPTDDDMFRMITDSMNTDEEIEAAAAAAAAFLHASEAQAPVVGDLTDEDIEAAAAAAAAFLCASEVVQEAITAPTPPPPSSTTGKRKYVKKQKLSPDQRVPMYSEITHNKVKITDPQMTDFFFECPEVFSDEDVKRIKNVQFDTTQSGHAPARQACHTMKMLYLISETYNIPASQLMSLCGSMESHKCQATYAGKGGVMTRCSQPCSVGHFFCGGHKNDYTHQAGASMLKKRRLGL